MPTTDQSITWDDVREIPYTELVVGDRYINPRLGTAYSVSPDGRVRGLVWTPLEGTIWTVTAVTADGWTVRNADGLVKGPARPRYASASALRIN